VNAIILAGGRDRGEQLRPLAYPAHLLPVANRSVIELQLEWLARQRVKTAIVVMDHRGASVASPPPSGLELRVHYSPGLTGMAGAVALAQSVSPDEERVLLVDGSILTTIDLEVLVAAHERFGASVTTAVPTDGRRHLRRPRPTSTPGGISIVEQDVVHHHFETRYVAMSGYWRDLRSPEAYLAAQLDALAGRLGPLPGQEIRPGVFSEGAVHILSSAEVTGPVLMGGGSVIGERAAVSESVIGASCIIAADARIERSVVLDGARIGRGAVVRDSIVGPCAAVAEGASITGLSVVGPGARVLSGQQVSQASVA